MAQFLHRAILEGRLHAAMQKSWTWLDANILDLGRQMRVSYLPPLMVYMAAGISGFTAIVGTFFVKDYLGLSAEFLAMLGFWAGIPWALKMPLGHIVDLVWRWKSLLVFVGAALIAASLGIMLGLLSAPSSMAQYMSIEAWFVLSTLLSPFGYVVQDVVADAMTVEAVPMVDDAGQPYDEHTIKLMHTTMQTLGRVAIIGGGIAVSLVNILMFRGAGDYDRSGEGCGLHRYLQAGHAHPGDLCARCGLRRRSETAARQYTTPRRGACRRGHAPPQPAGGRHRLPTGGSSAVAWSLPCSPSRWACLRCPIIKKSFSPVRWPSCCS